MSDTDKVVCNSCKKANKVSILKMLYLSKHRQSNLNIK